MSWPWLSEHGKARAELGLVLRALTALDLSIFLRQADQTDVNDLPDIDAVMAAAKGNEK